jgi:hypothetical protein
MSCIHVFHVKKHSLCSLFHTNFNKIKTTILFYGLVKLLVTSVDPDQQAHPCHMIWNYTVFVLVRNNPWNVKVNSVDSDGIDISADLDLQCSFMQSKVIFMKERINCTPVEDRSYYRNCGRCPLNNSDSCCQSSWNLGKLFMGIISRLVLITSQSASGT